MEKYKEKFYEKLEEYINSLTNKDDVKILNYVIENDERITDKLLEFISLKSGILKFTLENSIKFYPKFKKNYENSKNIILCKGVRCGQNQNLHNKIEEYIYKNHKDIVIDEKRCLGRCKNSPVIKINNTVIEFATFEKIVEKLR